MHELLSDVPPPRAAAPLRLPLRDRLRRRPQVGQETLALAASLYVAIACNGAFWQGCAAALPAGRAMPVLAALFVAIVALQALALACVLSRWSAKPLLAATLVVAVLAGHFAARYRVYFDVEMLRNVLHTEPAEAAEWLGAGLFADLALRAGPPLALLAWLRLRPRPWRRALLRRGVFATAALAVALAALLPVGRDVAALMHDHKDLRYLIAPGNVVVGVLRALGDDAGDAAAARVVVAGDATAGAPPSHRPRLLVIVVGETVRAADWGLDGYARQTTPELAAIPGLLNFADVTACGTSTEVSLPCLFSLQGRRAYDRAAIRRSESLLHVLERAGIATLWRDNQTGCKGVCAGLAYENLAAAADPRWCDDERCLDEVLLTGLGARLRRDGGDQVVVLHPLGNHGPAYYRRYPPAFRRWTPTCDSAELGRCSRAEVVNAYDDAVLYTDHFVAAAIAFLQRRTDVDGALLFVSDHGESLGEHGLYLHGVPYAIAPDVQLKVPMVAWLSPGWRAARGYDDACLQAATRRPASHDDVFSTVLGLLQVRTRAYAAQRDLFAGCAART